MAKTKLAICFGDKEYQRRFVKCFMHHFESQYEVHVFGAFSELKQDEEKNLQVLLLDGVKESELCELKEFPNVILCLVEEENLDEEVSKGDVVYVSKYQEVYKIEQLIKGNWLKQSCSIQDRCVARKRTKLVGVFSLNCEEYQIPFGGMLAAEYGESAKTILLNIQPMSGLGVDDKEEYAEPLSLEDLLAAVAADNYTRNLLLGGIAHEQNWDYVYPAKNSECLTEADVFIYEKLLEVLSQELEYECVILNFGAIFSGVFAFMGRCEALYYLVPDRERNNWREKEFKAELERQDKDELLVNAVKIKVPEMLHTYGDWRMVSQTLRWSSIGDQVRRYRQMEWANG